MNDEIALMELNTKKKLYHTRYERIPNYGLCELGFTVTEILGTGDVLTQIKPLSEW